MNNLRKNILLFAGVYKRYEYLSKLSRHDLRDTELADLPDEQHHK